MSDKRDDKETNVVSNISIDKIYDHNINFLIGSGASVGLFPTLGLKIEKGKYTVETLAEKFENESNENLKTLLFMHYYRHCIKPIEGFNSDTVENETEGTKKTVIQNYKDFLETLLKILEQKPDKKINLFTTNYDGCLPLVANELLKRKEFVINDGTLGFRKKYLQAQNFNISSYKSGVFDQYKVDIPQINLINLHGSIYWQKADDDNILVDYSDKPVNIGLSEKLTNFSQVIEDENKTIDDLYKIDSDIPDEDSDNFWKAYKSLPIVNPTKWKFHETVFEEHYYQMLRLMSYELEKPTSVLIVFGFSFADEHIKKLIKRSLSNPKLQVYVCCFNEDQKNKMQEMFNQHPNVIYVCSESGVLDFYKFKSRCFFL